MSETLTYGKVVDAKMPAELMQIISQSLSIRSHIEVFLWLNGEIQRFLHHDILLVAWGDFSTGKLLFDVISAIPGVRTHKLVSEEVTPFVTRSFEGWVSRGSSPYTLESAGGFTLGDDAAQCLPVRAVRNMRSAIVHGIKDVRGSNNCLYVFLSREAIHSPQGVRSSVELLLPYLDTALRRLHHMQPESELRHDTTPPPALLGGSAPKPLSNLGMSGRELEIMAWVREGKTNHEIGQILEISVFTVKNHLQRIFKKLNVYNRAQAVARMSLPLRRESVQ